MRIEIRNDSVLLSGYINCVDRESRILPSPRGKFKEKIMPKTFEKALLKGRNVDLLFNHKKDHKLGSLAEGNLELREDNIGLLGTATVTCPEVMEHARNGRLSGWSFGFITLRDTWSDGTDGIQLRQISDLDLLEVSVLTNTPAYIATSIEARGEEAVITEQRSEEFTATVTDNTEKKEETKVDEKVKEEELEEELEDKTGETPDFSLLDNEIEILKLKGM